MKRLRPSLLQFFFVFALVIPAGAVPPVAARPQAALLPALPRLSALPGLPPAAAAPREGQGETEREFYGLLRAFESADEAHRNAAPGSPAQREADQRRRELYDRGIGILTRERALLDSSPGSLENFAMEMDSLYAPYGAFTLRDQILGYATMYGWRAFTEATQRELARETDWRRLLKKAEDFEQRYRRTRGMREGEYDAAWGMPSSWQMAAYATVTESAYQAAIPLQDHALVSWRETEELAYSLEALWRSTPKESGLNGVYYQDMNEAYDAAFSLYEHELVSGRLNEADIASALERAELRSREEKEGAGVYAFRLRWRLQHHRASGR